MLFVFNKPYGVISQFTPDGSPHRPLKEFGFPPDVYPIGRLDADSEGLLLLSDEADLNRKLLRPENNHHRIYWVQVERVPTPEVMAALQAGPTIQGYKTKPCRAILLDPQPEIPARVPPIRMRKSVPDCWIEMELVEGKNRQVRHMTAAVGHPTLRLIRKRIGSFDLDELPPGKWKKLGNSDREKVFKNINRET